MKKKFDAIFQSAYKGNIEVQLNDGDSFIGSISEVVDDCLCMQCDGELIYININYITLFFFL